MADMPSPEELKERRENAARKAFMLNRPMSIADFAPEEEPPGAFATGSPSSPEGQKVFRATEKASLTPPNAPSATALMAEEALGIPIEKAALKAAKPVIDAAKPVVDAAKPYFDSVVEGLTSMVKKTPKDKSDNSKAMLELAQRRTVLNPSPPHQLYRTRDGVELDIEEIIWNDNGKVGKALEAIAFGNNKTPPVLQRIAARIEPIVRNVPVRLVETLDDAFDAKLDNALGIYDPATHSIRLRSKRLYADLEDAEKELYRGYDKGEVAWVGSSFAKLERQVNRFNRGSRGHLTEETVVHEALHAATVRRFFDGRHAKNAGTPLHKASKDISKLYQEVKSILPLDDFPVAMTNELEFIAYGLTNLSFQHVLKNTKIGPGQTLWSKFVSMVGKLLGIEASDYTALGELLRATDELLDAPLQDMATFYDRTK